jgi:hypothetical protein
MSIIYIHKKIPNTKPADYNFCNLMTEEVIQLFDRLIKERVHRLADDEVIAVGSRSRILRPDFVVRMGWNYKQIGQALSKYIELHKDEWEISETKSCNCKKYWITKSEVKPTVDVSTTEPVRCMV